jgi:hypothetical protein
MPSLVGLIRTVCRLAAALTILSLTASTCWGQANSVAAPPLWYSTPLEEISPDTPRIEPWKSIPLDPLYKGMWVVAGDVDGDGEVELVSARLRDVADVHYTASIVVHKLDGSVLWRWGQPEQGVFPLHSDVACQIYDWDGDGKNEVIVAAERAVVEIDGATGIEKRRFAIPPDASDCIVFCNLTGGPRATDILVKTRYSQIWAFDRAGKHLWTYKTPGAYRTAHQPRPIDVDGDGRDEIVAGFLMLNPDGSERWVLREGDPSLARWKPLVEGHLDCARLLSRGATPADSTLAITFCGAERIALVRGTGEVIWSVYGKHFESIDLGKVCRSVDGRQLVVDIPYAPRGNQPLWIFDQHGRLLGEIIADYSRIHRLVDWHGEGVESIVVGSPPTLYDGETGKRLAIFDMPGGRVETRSKEEVPYICSTGDMTGDGVVDVLFLDCARGIVQIYKNEHGRPPTEPASLGTGVNWTLY